jgi:hypothetical protein
MISIRQPLRFDMYAPMAPDAGPDTKDGVHQMHRLHPHSISPRISDRS